MTVKFSDAALGAALSALGALCDGGTLKVYSSPQPADVNQAATGTLLATLTFGSPAFASAAVSGPAGSRVATAAANAISPGPAAAGTAAWFRAFRPDGVTAVMDGSAGPSGCDLNFEQASFPSGASVSVSSFTISQNE